LQVHDGTTQDQVTAVGGSAISGFNVGGLLLKDKALANAITVANNDQGRIVEASGAPAYFQFTVVQKTATNTFIRMQYTTTDAPIDAQIEWHCIWRPGPDDAGTLVAV